MRLRKKEYEYWLEYLIRDSAFTNRYMRQATCGQRRALIREAIYVHSSGSVGTDIEDGEQFRRYFDVMWNITTDPEGAKKYISLPPVVWDEPPSKPWKLATRSEPKKETTMKTNPIEITTKTFVNGVDIATMPDSDIYGLITSEELRIKELNTITNKPKRLVNEIAKREAGIKALVDYLDSKD